MGKIPLWTVMAQIPPTAQQNFIFYPKSLPAKRRHYIVNIIENNELVFTTERLQTGV